MDSMGAVIALVVVAIMIVGGAAMAQVAFEDTGDLQSFSEGFNASSTGDLVVLNQSNREGVYYQDTVNVTNESGSLMIDGQDYEWYEDNGTLEVLSTDLTNTNATIQYGYRVPSEQQRNVSGYLGSIFSSAAYLPYVLILLLVIIAASILGGLA